MKTERRYSRDLSYVDKIPLLIKATATGKGESDTVKNKGISRSVMSSNAVDLTADDVTPTAACPLIKSIPVEPNQFLSMAQRKQKISIPAPPTRFPPIKFIHVNPPSKCTTQPRPVENSIKNNLCKVKKVDPSLPWQWPKWNFIDHVVKIWLDRARRGDRNIIMPDSVIKARGKETAKILNKFAKFSPTDWVRAFKVKMEEEDAQRPTSCTTGYPSLKIADIVKEEWSQFFGNESLPESIDMVKAEENEDPIQTYSDALDCLKVVEDFAISAHSSEAIELMTQIEQILREGEDP